MRYALNADIDEVMAPPIGQAWAWTRSMVDDDRALLDLGQGMPADPPPPELRAHLAEVMGGEDHHFYTPPLGRGSLRRALAAHLSEAYEGVVSDEQVAITAGCNQAFCLALAAIADAGDEVILPLPYYFNHPMWLQANGIGPVHLPYEPDRGGVPDPEAAAARITARTRAIVLVSPNNPTGAIYPHETIEAFYSLARERGLALILDETYKDYAPGPAHGLFRHADWDDTLIQLYSFSKVYHLTGHRVGSLAGSPRLLEAVAKLADCVAICPPTAGQAAALYGLQHLGPWREANRQQIAERAVALREAFEQAGLGYELVSLGAFYAYLRHPFDDESATEVARRLVQRHKVLMLPGDMFGPGQGRYLRLAFANVAADRFPELITRLHASQADEGTA